jgi:hypothetical protein
MRIATVLCLNRRCILPDTLQMRGVVRTVTIRVARVRQQGLGQIVKRGKCGLHHGRRRLNGATIIAWERHIRSVSISSPRLLPARANSMRLDQLTQRRIANVHHLEDL